MANFQLLIAIAISAIVLNGCVDDEEAPYLSTDFSQSVSSRKYTWVGVIDLMKSYKFHLEAAVKDKDPADAADLSSMRQQCQSTVFDMHVGLTEYSIGLMKRSKPHWYNIADAASLSAEDQQSLDRNLNQHIFPDSETFTQLSIARNEMWAAAHECMRVCGDDSKTILRNINDCLSWIYADVCAEPLDFDFLHRNRDAIDRRQGQDGWNQRGRRPDPFEFGGAQDSDEDDGTDDGNDDFPDGQQDARFLTPPRGNNLARRQHRGGAILSPPDVVRINFGHHFPNVGDFPGNGPASPFSPPRPRRLRFTPEGAAAPQTPPRNAPDSPRGVLAPRRLAFGDDQQPIQAPAHGTPPNQPIQDPQTPPAIQRRPRYRTPT